MPNSPKGSYRLWQTIPFLVFGVVGLYLLDSEWGNKYIGTWLFIAVKFFVAETLGLLAFYYGSRLIAHHRTHELTSTAKITRGHVQTLCVSLVTSAALLASF